MHVWRLRFDEVNVTNKKSVNTPHRFIVAVRLKAEKNIEKMFSSLSYFFIMLWQPLTYHKR